MELQTVTKDILEQVKKYELARYGGGLRALRTINKLSQTELSEMAGVEEYVISMIENRSKQPSLTTLQKLSAAFGMTLKEFFIYSESKTSV